MPTIAVIPNRFAKVQAAQAGAASSRFGPGATRSPNVRRPTRGIQIKEDTYATLKVLRGDGTEIPLIDAGSRNKDISYPAKSKQNSNFLIQSVGEERVEKQQIVETFGEAFIFFFGERPRVINVQGVLLNTFDFNWEAEWWANYDQYLRGTKCVENDARVFLTFDQTLVSGYIISTSSTKSAPDKNYVGFTFQLFVTDYTLISKVGNPDAMPPGAKSPVQGRVGKLNRRGDNGPALLQYSRRPGVSLPGAPSLVSSLLGTGMRAVNSAMATARQVANAALLPAAYLDRFLGNAVRVPIGFAGAVALDETKVNLDQYWAENATYPGLDYPVTYTTFGKNDDEFIADPSSQAYAGSTLKVGHDSSFAKGSSVGAAATVEMANLQWASYGLLMPTGSLGEILSAVTANPIGMKIVGSARNWLATKGAKVSSAVNQQVDKVAPIAATTQNVLMTAAIADNLVGAVSPSASQALDRMLPASAAAANSGFSAQLTVLESGAAQASVLNTVKGIADNGADSFTSFLANATKAGVGGQQPAQPSPPVGG